MAKILLIDNYDSFTYNLVQAFLSLGAEVDVHRNNEIAIGEVDSLQPTHLVISPGPGRPENAGISLACIEVFQDKIPILGVCLGHQCIVEHFGGDIVLKATFLCALGLLLRGCDRGSRPDKCDVPLHSCSGRAIGHGGGH